MNKKEIVRKALSQTFDRDVELNIVGSFFSKDYEQYVDDTYIDYADFIKHLEKVRALTKNLSIEFLQLIEEGSIVFSRHKATSTMLDGSKNVFIVFAEFHINQDGKIGRCIETTRLLEGSKEHETLGSDK